MTIWWGTRQQVEVDRSQLLPGVYCCPGHTSSALQTSEYFIITLCMPCTIIVFVYLGLHYKWYQRSSNNFRHTSCIQKGFACWEVAWPNDLQTRRSQYTGIPLDRLNWNHNGWCYHPVVFQWQSSVDLHNWNTLEDHWSHKYTGMPLEPHWLMLAPSVNLHNRNTLNHHWKTTRRPLEAHWKHTGYQQLFVQCHSSVH